LDIEQKSKKNEWDEGHTITVQMAVFYVETPFAGFALIEFLYIQGFV